MVSILHTVPTNSDAIVLFGVLVEYDDHGAPLEANGNPPASA